VWEGKHFEASDEALKRFREAWPDYEADREFVAELAQRDPRYAALKEEELVAIRSYTAQDWYGEANRALREHDEAAIARYRRHIEAATSGLNKLPGYEGLVTRGISIPPGDLPSFLEKFHPDGIAREDQFTSTDTSKAFTGNVNFEIRSASGSDVAALSRYSGSESEGLVPARERV
jgi:hypothetical protein